MENIVYDAIIIGGGPSGLSVGAELSKLGNKIALIEKGIIGDTNRAWIVPGSIISELDSDIQAFAYNGVKRFMEFTPNLQIEWDAFCPWTSDTWKSYPYIKQKDLLCYWAQIIKQNNSCILEKHIYIDKEISSDKTKVKAINLENGDSIILEARLIIDASGYSSQIAKQERINKKDFFWWSVYGFELYYDDIKSISHPGTLGQMKVGDYMLWQSFDSLPFNKDESLSELRPIMEYEVLDEHRVFVFILYFCNEVIDKDFMQNQYNYLINNDKNLTMFREGTKETERFGWYPSAGINQNISKDRLVFIGDSGCWTIPAGWGMSFILQNYKLYAKNINKSLKENKLDKKSLNKASHFNTKERYEILADKLVLHFLSYAKPDFIDRFTRCIFDNLSGKMLEIMFCLKLSRRDIFRTLKVVLKEFSIKELLSIFKLKDYALVIHIALEFSMSWILDLVRILFKLPEEEAGFKFQKEKGVRDE